MAKEYASTQPQGFKNHVEKVAIVGAGGRLGKFIAEALVKTGKHHVTAITRADSTSQLPAGLATAKVNYDDPSSLVAALQGQDMLIITMAVMAPPDTETKLIDAAAAAGVPYVIPNEWGSDPTQKALGKDILITAGRDAHRARIEELGKSAWISFVCSFWYEFSLAGQPERYGFDFPGRKVTFFDDGNTKINTSTWPQCGRAVAGLLSLPLLPADEHDTSPCLSGFRHKFLFISSFLLSQKDMFASVLRVTGTTEADWAIDYEDVKKRYNDGKETMQKGDMRGFGKLLYSRVFYPDGSGNYEAREPLQNEVLGLPKEDLDEYTKIAVKMAEETVIGFGD